jgi:hypothetical protein
VLGAKGHNRNWQIVTRFGEWPAASRSRSGHHHPVNPWLPQAGPRHRSFFAKISAGPARFLEKSALVKKGGAFVKISEEGGGNLYQF